MNQVLTATQGKAVRRVRIFGIDDSYVNERDTSKWKGTIEITCFW